MGLLKFFSKPNPGLQTLPSGTMTVDRNARVLAATVSSAHSRKLQEEIGRQVLKVFREARKAQMPLSEVSIHFASLEVTAREMRGGAIIFLAPKK